jgi:membrane protein YqaA with SNARE-associated domain
LVKIAYSSFHFIIRHFLIEIRYCFKVLLGQNVIENFTLGGLFLSAFLSSTVLPGSSEVVLAVIANQKSYDPWVLLSVATAGNTLGGMSSWGLGMLISWKFPFSRLSKPNQQRAIERIQRWGSPALLLSWVPVVGDPLCIAAGWLKVNGWVALLFIGIGKALRYAVIVALV